MTRDIVVGVPPMAATQLPTENARPAPTKSRKQPSPAPEGSRALRQLTKLAAAVPSPTGHNGGPALMPRAPPTIRKHAYTLQELSDLGYGSAAFYGRAQQVHLWSQRPPHETDLGQGTPRLVVGENQTSLHLLDVDHVGAIVQISCASSAACLALWASATW